MAEGSRFAENQITQFEDSLWKLEPLEQEISHKRFAKRAVKALNNMIVPNWEATPSSMGRDESHLFRPTMTVRRGEVKAYLKVLAIQSLTLDRFAVIGHDWGARAAYTMAALFPERLTAIAALALAYQPRGLFELPDFEQSRRFWYQWFQCTERGSEAVRKDPVGFARIQWDTWSPPGWFNEAEFTATAETFLGPDWPAITLNAYRARWMPGEATDAHYNALRLRLREIDCLSTPTLMIQGASDFCDAPKDSEGLERFFGRAYRRVLLDEVGHFPHREAPGRVADAVLRLLETYARP